MSPRRRTNNVYASGGSSPRRSSTHSTGTNATPRTRRTLDQLSRPRKAGANTRAENTGGTTKPGRMTLPDDESTSSAMSEHEPLSEDDVCPVCQLLLYRPVTTSCNHTLCESCMATWADVSVSTQMQIVDVDEEMVAFNPVSGLEARCPMCRTQTSASIDDQRTEDLRNRYPRTYAERQTEGGESTVDTAADEIQTLVLNIGNKHALKGSAGEDGNIHEWTFFVRPSRTDIIEEVHIHLHPTFRPRTIIRTRSPYEVRRLGWGYFTIVASVILKAGYSWMSDDAEDSPDGAERGMLSLEWPLDFSRFNRRGSMGRLRLRVKNQRDWRDVNDEIEEDERTRAMLIRQYETDGIYVPEEE